MNRKETMKSTSPVVAVTLACAVALLAVACKSPAREEGAAPAELAEIRKTTQDAYIYGYPVVDNYRFLYARSVDKADRMYLAPINLFGHEQDVKKAGENAVQTVNGDTPYSGAVLDLRAEPFVLTVPKIEKNRYFTM